MTEATTDLLPACVATGSSAAIPVVQTSDVRAANEVFGAATSLDGNLLLVGANGVAAATGVAYLFSGAAGGTQWTQINRFQPTGAPAGGLFGYSVSLRGDTAVMGAVGTSNTGAAYLYTSDPTQWAKAAGGAGQRFVPDVTLIAGEQFGFSVALSADAAAIGAPASSANKPGSVYLYERTGSPAVWGVGAPKVHLYAQGPENIANNKFGQSVALQGYTLIVGAPGVNQAYVFDRAGATWSFVTRLSPPASAPGLNFGWSVALDGNTALIGAPYDTTNKLVGRAYVYKRVNGVWAYENVLIPNETPPSSYVGSVVALSGELAVLGASGHMVTYVGNVVGSAYQFTRTSSGWIETGPKLFAPAPDGAVNDYFGFSIAASSGPGGAVAIGTIGAESLKGKVFLFNRKGCP